MDKGTVQIKWIIPEDDGIDMKIVTEKLKKVYKCITILNMKEWDIHVTCVSIKQAIRAHSEDT